MKHKRLLLILIVSLFCSLIFAEDSYRLSVVSADDMSVSESMVTLEGRVVISFSTSDGGESEKTRELKADKVIIDVDNKCLDALGNVFLSEGSDSTFRGDALSLNWDTLDIVVFGGISSSDRKGVGGNTVKFYTVGNRIAYSGESNAVFFQNGVISTRESDPYWSIHAQNIGLADTDLFFTNATLKLGRVPVFWLPVLFYPGNRLSFNPAIGFSSSKGQFLNTTYELYGIYPGIGGSSVKSSGSDDATALATNFLSFLGSESSEKEIHSGWSYMPVNGSDLSPIQKWAVDSGSYLAVFADAWEKYGLSFGYFTKNNLLKRNLTISSTGLINYRIDSPLRFVFDLNADYKISNSSFSLKVPLASDPDVRYDLLNRNTVFGLDSAFGVKQSFPSTYSSGSKTYSIVLDGSSSISKGGVSVKLKSLKSQIDYEWNTSEKKYEMKNATLPYISIDSSGTIVNYKGEAESLEEVVPFSNALAQKFFDEYQQIKDLPTVHNDSAVNAGLLKATAVSNVKKISEDPGSFKIDYSYKQVVDNGYAKEFKHTSFFTSIDAALNFSGNTYGNWFGFKDSVSASFNTNIKEEGSNSKSFKLIEALTINSTKIGLSYGIKANLYTFENSENKQTDKWVNWNKTDIIEHYFNFNKKVSDFTLGLKYVLPPLDQLLVPSVSYSRSGFTASADISFSTEKGSLFKPTVSHGNISYKNGSFEVSFNNTYDFKKGYSGTEQLSYAFLNKRLKLSEKLNLEKNFAVKDLVFLVNFDKNSVQLSFKDKTVTPDRLDIVVNHSVDPLYFWKNRVGMEGSVDFGFTYDFRNKYNSSMYANATVNFSVNRFLDLSLSIKSTNNSFYRYYTKNGSGEKFDFSILWNDLIKSFDFFGNGRKSTGFNLSSFSINVVHYLEDWTLNLSASSKITTVNGKNRFVPEFTFLVKWDAIPELKTANSWKENTGWDIK